MISYRYLILLLLLLDFLPWHPFKEGSVFLVEALKEEEEEKSDQASPPLIRGLARSKFPDTCLRENVSCETADGPQCCLGFACQGTKICKKEEKSDRASPPLNRGLARRTGFPDTCLRENVSCETDEGPQCCPGFVCQGTKICKKEEEKSDQASPPFIRGLARRTGFPNFCRRENQSCKENGPRCCPGFVCRDHGSTGSKFCKKEQ